MELSTMYDFSLLEEKAGWHADKNGDAMGIDISFSGGILRFAVKEVKGNAVCFVEKAGKQRNYLDFGKKMSATEMQNLVSEFVKNLRQTGAFMDGSADSIIAAVQSMREKPEAGGSTNIAGAIEVEVVEFLGDAKEKEQFASGNIVPLTLVKADTLDEFVSFVDVYKSAMKVGTFSEKNVESFFQKYEYMNEKKEHTYALEHSKDISEGFSTDIYHFREDFNAPSALYFLRQHQEQLKRKK
jgi:hypothetical protein